MIAATMALPLPAALAGLLPEGLLLLGIVAVLVLDAVPSPGRARRAPLLGLLAALGATAAALLQSPVANGGMLAFDAVAHLVRPVLAGAVALLLLVRFGEARDARGGSAIENGAIENGALENGAWTTAVLGIGFGALLVATADNLLPFWIGLETISVASYALTAWRADRRSAEAGMKFVLFGGAATATTLLGMSHLYGLTGRFDFAGIGAGLAAGMPLPVTVALLLASAGAAYKLTLVPLHFYSPDVHEGAPATSLAVITAVPKLALGALLVRALPVLVPQRLPGGGGLDVVLGNGLAMAAIASLLVASLTALVQRDAKRIIAFSGVGHAGTVVLAMSGLPDPMAGATVLYYLFGYAAANTGALLCLAVLERRQGDTSLAALRGAVREHPWVTVALCLFVFSLAGVPPLAGFFGKWSVLQQALALGTGDPARPLQLWAVGALLLSTAIAAWSYLLIVRAVVLGGDASLASDEVPGRPVRRTVPLAMTFVLVALAAVTIGLGCWLDCLPTLGGALRP